MYGLQYLTKEQLYSYGLFEEKDKQYIFPIARFKTLFVTVLWFPLFPLKTQIIIDAEDGSFYAFPVELYWKQAFAVLSFAYFLVFFTVCLYLLITGGY